MSQHIYTYDPVNDQLDEIGGAGHVIKNESGTSFAKRQNLQFNGMSVEDDSTNNSTIVSAVETNFVGTYAAWQALSLAERAQYKTVDLKDDFNGAPIDDYPTENSPNPVSSGGVYSQIGNLSNLETAEKSNLVGAINEAAASGGGGGSTISVNTTDTELFGKVVTLTDGVTTLTKTFSTLGVALFNNVTMIGTLIISCENSSVNLNVPYYGKYSAVIEGGFNWRTWVDTAQFLDSSDYNSLDEVLADELAVRELCLEHACVDYLADITTANEDVETIINNDLFAKWVNNSDYSLDVLGANVVIKALMDEADKYGYGEWVITDDSTTPPTWGPKGNVPVMTANNAPYGEASAYRVGSGSNAWAAFDGDPTTYYSNGQNRNTSDYLQYKFVNPVCVKRFSLLPYSALDFGAYSIKASNDGVNWTTLFSDVNESTDLITQDISNEDYYLYYRVTNDANANSWWTIKDLQFYGRELKVSVPIMTSNTAPYGEAFASSIYSSAYAAWKAFTASDAWADNSTNAGEYVGYDFGRSVKIKMLAITTHGVVAANRASISIEGNNSGNNFEEIEVFDNCPTTASTTFFKNISNPQAFKRFIIKDKVGGTDYWNVDRVQFYGFDYSEKEFEAGTTKKWLYDHGVELVEFENSFGTQGGSIVEESDQVVAYDGTSDGNSNSAWFITKNAIDLGNHSLLFAKWGDKILGYTTSGANYGDHGGTVVYSGKPIASNYNTGLVATIGDQIPIESLNFALDVSAISGSNYIGFGLAYWANLHSSCKELWLE